MESRFWLHSVFKKNTRVLNVNIHRTQYPLKKSKKSIPKDIYKTKKKKFKVPRSQSSEVQSLKCQSILCIYSAAVGQNDAACNGACFSSSSSSLLVCCPVPARLLGPYTSPVCCKGCQSGPVGLLDCARSSGNCREGWKVQTVLRQEVEDSSDQTLCSRELLKNLEEKGGQLSGNLWMSLGETDGQKP